MIEKGINVFAITDHFCVDNIDNFHAIALKKRNEGHEIYFLPGIEIKTDKGDKSVHITGIFPERDKNNHQITTAYLKDNLLSQLECTETKLIDIGRTKLGEGKTDEDYRKRGQLEYTVNFERAVEKIKALGGLCVVHAGHKSNSIEEEIDHARTDDDSELLNSLGHMKETLMRDHIDVCELPNFNDASIRQRDFYLKQFGKPSIVCSDLHSISDIGHKYIWIKGDPTFEGLKQIICEPCDRVRIQEEQPGKSLDYMIIDKVSFKDTIKKQFFTDYIVLNENLNAIIGGKSSGKSLLLYHIAKTVDPDQVQQKMQILQCTSYDFETDAGFDFEVIWKDGYVMSLKNISDRQDRRITYIPQMYINHLAEEKGETQLRHLIDDVLEQNDEYRIFIDDKRSVIQHLNTQISNLLTTLFVLRENNVQVVKEIKEIGDLKAIDAQIKTLSKQIETLTKASGFTKEESELYEKLIKIKAFHEQQVERFTSVYNAFALFKTKASDNFKDSAEDELKSNEMEVKSYLDGDRLALRLLTNLVGQKQALLTQFFINYEAVDNELIARVREKINKHKTILETLNTQLKPFLSKVKNQKHLKELQKLLKTEQEKKVKIAEKEKKHAEILEKGKTTRQQLLNDYKTLHATYRSIVEKLGSAPFNRISDDLELKAYLTFDADSFETAFCSVFDKRKPFSIAFGTCFKDNHFIYTHEEHDQHINHIFEKLSLSQLESTGLRLNAGFSLRDAAINLLGDYFNIKYTITHGVENILKMSPGKRGLVLLQLILHLSNAAHPILIDQPEDNLDNRTVYYELNQFIKEKKNQRQIMFVTHNANLVVSTDAENIIVANQSGQDVGKDNKEGKFEYVSGALEYSFRDNDAKGILYTMGIREHVCEILEGGQDAFEKREKKYGFK
jgi:hypothetical protein